MPWGLEDGTNGGVTGALFITLDIINSSLLHEVGPGFCCHYMGGVPVRMFAAALMDPLFCLLCVLRLSDGTELLEKNDSLNNSKEGDTGAAL